MHPAYLTACLDYASTFDAEAAANNYEDARASGSSVLDAIDETVTFIAEGAARNLAPLFGEGHDIDAMDADERDEFVMDIAVHIFATVEADLFATVPELQP